MSDKQKTPLQLLIDGLESAAYGWENFTHPNLSQKEQNEHARGIREAIKKAEELRDTVEREAFIEAYMESFNFAYKNPRVQAEKLFNQKYGTDGE